MLNGLRPALNLAAHNAWKQQWRLGFGPLQVAEDVTLVGQQGVEVTGAWATVEVRHET